MSNSETSLSETVPHSPEKIFIGVAWPYANGHLHLGHIAGSLLSPDIFSRYHRLRGNRVLMVSGSDEHGTPITVTAHNEGITPEQVADRYHQTTLQSLDMLDIDFDLFTRTHNPHHIDVVQDVFTSLMEKGYIEKRSTHAQYCPSCHRFLPDRYVEGSCPLCGAAGARGDQCDECGKTLDATELKDPKCKLCGAAPEIRETEHFFLLLTKFRDALLDYIDDKDHWKKNVRKFTENWLLEGLKDRAITRDMTWGIPIPLDGYDTKRIYVWFEAVTGYFAASKEWALCNGSPDAWKDFWQDPTCRHYYFLGKDNIPFHTIIWPSILMGYGDLNLPYDVPANEYLRFEGDKFSKSRGVGAYIKDFLKTYDSDACRYYLSYNMPEQRDTDFTEEDFITAINSELVANFGNFIHRTLSFTAKNFGEIPAYDESDAAALTELDQWILRRTEESLDRVATFIEKCEFKNGIREIMALSKDANKYFNDKAPWKQLKEDRHACGLTLHVGLKVAKALTVAAFPYMPHAATELWKALGEYSGDGSSGRRIEDAGWAAAREPLRSGRKLEMPRPIFKKLQPLKKDDEQEGDAAQKGAGSGSKKGKKSKKNKKKKKQKQVDPIALSDVQLKVSLIKEIEEHPDAEKLYVMKIDCGNGDERQLVAGLRTHYRMEEMRGRKIIVVANLQPAKLRGVESQGMLLAADLDERVSFLTPSDSAVEIGTLVRSCNNPNYYTSNKESTTEVTEEHRDISSGVKPQIDIMQFVSLQMRVCEISAISDEAVTVSYGDESVELSVTSSCAALSVGDRAVVVLPNGKQENSSLLMVNEKPVVPEREIPVGARIK